MLFKIQADSKIHILFVSLQGRSNRTKWAPQHLREIKDFKRPNHNFSTVSSLISKAFITLFYYLKVTTILLIVQQPLFSIWQKIESLLMRKHIYPGTSHGQIHSVLIKTLLQARGLWKKNPKTWKKKKKKAGKDWQCKDLTSGLKSVAEPRALGVIYLSTAFQQSSKSSVPALEGAESCEEPVLSPDSGVSLCILKGRCCFIIIFPLYNKCYLSNLMYLSVV